MRKRNAVKRIAAVLASACLIVSMLATTVMAKPATKNEVGSLKITSSSTTGTGLKGYTFDLYKVAKIGFDESGNMTYTAEKDYESALNGLANLEDQTEVQKKLSVLSDAATGPATKTENVTEEKKSVVFTGLELGYYLVKVTAPKGASATSDFLVSIPSTKDDGTDLNYNVEVKLKTTTVDISKKGEILDATGNPTTAKSGNVGDKIKFTLEFHVPDTTGFTQYTYKITDTMSKGLQYANGSLKVSMDKNKTGVYTEIDSLKYSLKVNGPDVSTKKTEITVDFQKNLFAKADKTGNVAEYPVGAPLKVEYEATITKDAIDTASTGMTNKAVLTYSNNPGEDGVGTTDDIPSDEPKFFTFNLKLNKSFVPAPGDFSKVKFTLDGVKLSEKEDSNGGEYVVDPNGISGQELSLNTGDGTLKIYGLAEGTYYLNEVKTADGYNLLKDKVKVVIKATYGEDGKPNGSAEGSNKIDLATYFVNTDVVNKKGFTLPSTGGQGMVALVAAGICLMAAMAALMVSYMRKRRNA